MKDLVDTLRGNVTMADFKYAFAKLIKNEGGYVDDPSDSGGETYMGVSRNNYPEWEGWEIIDSYKPSASFPSILYFDRNLHNMVFIFYKKNYWDKIKGDLIPDTTIAHELLDSAVNLGIKTVSKFFQRGINLLNYKNTVGKKVVKKFKDLEIDGKIGDVTIKAYNSLSLFEKQILYTILNIMQGSYYIYIAEKYPKNKRFLKGWLSRRLNLDEMEICYEEQGII